MDAKRGVDVLVINLNTTRIKKSPRFLNQLIKEADGHEQVILSSEVLDTHIHLENLNHRERINRVFVVGGDSTFGSVTDWVCRRPRSRQPSIALIGGGQNCYLVKMSGFKTDNPLKNLRDIHSGRIICRIGTYYPLKIEDTASRKTQFASLVSNGIVADYIYEYDRRGKGNSFYVVFLMAWLIIKQAWRYLTGGRHIFKRTFGRLRAGRKDIGQKEYLAFLVSAVPTLSASMTPFSGTPQTGEIRSIAYWGKMVPLIPALIPILYWGKVPTWLNDIHNGPVEDFEVETEDNRFILDGDQITFPWPKGNGHPPKSTLLISSGPPIPLVTPIYDRPAA
ncbi:hypothetical protein ACFLZY_02550 [Patescibacteria group bacterium]